MAIAALALAFVAGATAVSSVVPKGLRARYFPNADWSGPPIIETLDPAPATSVLTARARPFLARYSVEWSGFILVSVPGRYTFTTTSDDGSQLAVGDAVVVSNGGAHGPLTVSGSLDLAPGVYPLVVRYFQGGGGYSLAVEWSRDGQPAAPIPLDRLAPDPVSYWGFEARRAAPALAGVALSTALWVFIARARRRPRAATPVAAAPPSALDQAPAAVALLLGAGVAVRLVTMAISDGIVWPDSDIFYLTARSILEGRFVEHDAFRTPLYPYFLAAFLRAGESPSVGALIVAAQHAMGLVATVLFYFLGRRAFSPRVALIGALVFTAHPVQLFYETSVLSEALFVAGLSVVLLLAGRALATPTPEGMATIGVACAGLTLVRPVAQWYALALVPIVCTVVPGLRRRLALVAMLALANAAALVPWMAVNQREYGFFGVALGQGLGLYTRVLDVDQLEPVQRSAFEEVRFLHDTGRRRGDGTANLVRDTLRYQFQIPMREVDRQMLGFAIETAAAHPAELAAGSVRQWVIQAGTYLDGVRTCASSTGRHLCSGRSTERDGKPAFPNRPVERWPRLRAVIIPLFSAGHVVVPVAFGLALLGALGYALDTARRNRAGALLGLSFLYFTLVPAMTQIPQDRYRLPVDVALFLFAAVGVEELVALLRGPRAGA